MMDQIFLDYVESLTSVANLHLAEYANQLALKLREIWSNKRRLFICGNGGSAANALHLANDFLYGIAKDYGRGIDVEALPANVSVVSCLANDISYEEIFAEQLRSKASAGDMLLVLSGSGNSLNIVKAIQAGRKIGMETVGIFGFNGGRSKSEVDLALHFPIDNMQIAEDMQAIMGHMCMKWLRENPPA